jgi:hypothetical protein
MPRARKKVIPIKDITGYPTCGDCMHYHIPHKHPNTKEINVSKQGFCWHNPPLPTYWGQEVESIRPTVEKDTRSCGKFRGSQ